jgi:hypothetical protein
VTADPNSPLSGIPPASLGAANALQPESQRSRPSPVELWLHRISVLMFVFVCASAGVLLIILPWMPQWTDNYLLTTFPVLRAIVANGFVRGLSSGLGVLDIWIGLYEAVHYRDLPHS